MPNFIVTVSEHAFKIECKNITNNIRIKLLEVIREKDHFKLFQPETNIVYLSQQAADANIKAYINKILCHENDTNIHRLARAFLRADLHPSTSGYNEKGELLSYTTVQTINTQHAIENKGTVKEAAVVSPAKVKHKPIEKKAAAKEPTVEIPAKTKPINKSSWIKQSLALFCCVNLTKDEQAETPNRADAPLLNNHCKK